MANPSCVLFKLSHNIFHVYLRCRFICNKEKYNCLFSCPWILYKCNKIIVCRNVFYRKPSFLNMIVSSCGLCCSQIASQMTASKQVYPRSQVNTKINSNNIFYCPKLFQTPSQLPLFTLLKPELPCNEIIDSVLCSQ